MSIVILSLSLLFVIVKIWDFFVLSKLLHFRRNLPLPRVRQLRDGDGGGEVFLKKYPADLSAMFTHTKCLLDFLCCLPLNISPSDGSFHLNNPLPLLLLV